MYASGAMNHIGQDLVYQNNLYTCTIVNLALPGDDQINIVRTSSQLHSDFKGGLLDNIFEIFG